MAIPNFIQTVGGRKTTAYANGVMPLAANTVLAAAGGRYMTVDGNGNYALSGAASTKLDAWANTCYQSDHSGATSRTNVTPFTGSATDGVSNVEGTENIHTEDDAFWIPSADTLTAVMKGLQCDLIVAGSGSTTLQKLKPSITTNKIVQVLDVNVKDQLALVYAIK